MTTTERFIAEIHKATPNGEYILVQHHPNGDWSVSRKCEPVPATNQAGEVEREAIARIIIGPRNDVPASEAKLRPTLRQLQDIRWGWSSDQERKEALWIADRVIAALATQPATSQEGEVRGWKCNNCQTVFTSAQQERKPNDSNGGPTCPYCKAHGQYTYPYALHQDDPCGGCGIAHDDVASGPCVPTLATKPETAQDGEDLESEIADAIDDSLDMDWTGSIGARHVMGLLRSKGLVA